MDDGVRPGPYRKSRTRHPGPSSDSPQRHLHHAMTTQHLGRTSDHTSTFTSTTASNGGSTSPRAPPRPAHRSEAVHRSPPHRHGIPVVAAQRLDDSCSACSESHVAAGASRRVARLVLSQSKEEIEVSTKETQERIIANMRKWQVEDATVTQMSEIISKTENPLIRLVMEIIRARTPQNHTIGPRR